MFLKNYPNSVYFLYQFRCQKWAEEIQVITCVWEKNFMTKMLFLPNIIF